MLNATTITVPTSGTPIQVAGVQPGAAVVVANIGGLDKAKVTAGPGDIVLFFGNTPSTSGLNTGVAFNAFTLLSGASITLPVSETISALSLTVPVTVSIVVGTSTDS